MDYRQRNEWVEDDETPTAPSDCRHFGGDPLAAGVETLKGTDG